MRTVVAVTMQLSLVMSVIFIVYVLAILVPYLTRRSRPAGAATDFEWHLFIPCRDEAAVIGTTIDCLRATFPTVHVWIIDDDSEDDTGAIAAELAGRDDRIHLVSRRRPEARTGKGDALNAAYRALVDHLGDRVDDPRIIIGVVDADGRLAPDCLAVCAGQALFGDPAVGAVQIEVRMVNRDDRRPEPAKGRVANFIGRTLIRMQDMEFRTVIAAMQNTRRYVGTVGMGGNGQFTRLTAIRSLDSGDGRAWRGSLLEDFELGLHLLLAGWKSEFTSDTYVDQEALFSIRRYLAQRTRWGQGVMQCGRYWPRIWASKKISNPGLIEMSYYLLQPWATLAGTLIYFVPAIVTLVGIIADPSVVWWFLHQGGWALSLVWLVAGLGPFMMWGPIYTRRCEPDQPWWRGLGWGIAYIVYVYGFYITTWRAFFRILTHRSGWAKTRRNAEVLVAGPVAKDT